MRKRKPCTDKASATKTFSTTMYFERMEPKILLSADALAGFVAADPFNTDDSTNSVLDINESADLLQTAYGLTADPSPDDTGIQLPASAEQPLNLDSLAGIMGDNPAINDTYSTIDVLETLLNDSSTVSDARHEIIFVDAATPDYQQLIDDISNQPDTNYQIFVLHTDLDGIEQMTGVLTGQQDIDAIHIVSHGDRAGLQLGDAWLSNVNIDNYAEQIQQWQTGMNEDADLLIYGCDLASAEAGQNLINDLADLTGMDVAASDDLTGISQMGGDWQLEYTTGAIETSVMADAALQQSWNNILGTINVTTTNDVVDADADLSSLANLFINPGLDGEVSLREAILAANADPGFDEINLAAATYTLSIDTGGSDDTALEGDLDITDALAIRGVSEAATVIDGALVNERSFDVLANNVAMSDLSIIQGGSSITLGGAMRVNPGFDVSLTDISLSGNYSFNGGGIYNDLGTVNLTRVDFTSNIYTENDGGAIYNNAGTVSITDSYFNGNLANNAGGAIYNNLGSVTLSRVDFTGNDAFGLGAGTGNGGAIFNQGGTINGTDVIFTNNHADEYGGAIYNTGSVTLDKALFYGNDTKKYDGGAINNDGGTVNLTNATLSANMAKKQGGAIHNINAGTLNIINSTFTANMSDDILLVKGIFQDITSTTNIKNSLLNDGTSNITGGIINSLGYNIDSDGTAIDKDLNLAFTSTGDQRGTLVTPLNTLLDVLADNGGFSKTHALLAGSVAINAGTNTGAPLVDQRGFLRSGTTDIGAFEYSAVNNAPSATNLSTVSAYTEGDASVAITDIVVSDVDTGEVITATLTLADTA
ncbi:MAG: DUF4347 domain-containing protein, partial [Gammaproteobacteria bacterium]|nr:DUF4347 domain-containing protein [Gammaproteobacteria bacterium]